jgi:hypothetical protein
LTIALTVSGIVVLRIRNVKSNEDKSVCTEQLSTQPSISFTKFEGTPSIVDFTTLPEAKTFYTSITNIVSQGSNFAGHFTLVSWGCGTDCVGYAVVNTMNGEIIAYNPVNGDYHLGNFTVDDNVFTLNPVHAGQERKFFQLIERSSNSYQLILACTELSSEEMYGLPE